MNAPLARSNLLLFEFKMRRFSAPEAKCSPLHFQIWPIRLHPVLVPFLKEKILDSSFAISDFQIILPRHILKQNQSLELMTSAHQLGLTAAGQISESLPLLMKRYAVKAAQIAERRFENIQLPVENRNIQDKMEFFGIRASEVFQEFYPEESTAPDHIIHVTCTGYVSPSPAQNLLSHRHHFSETNITHAYHMGCYAALPAIRMAEGFIKAKKQTVDIVHTEMCGLHMDRSDHSPEQIVVQSLFADGNIKYRASSLEQVKRGYRVLNISEQVIPDSLRDMSWLPSNWGMKMTLSREVPTKISSYLQDFLQKLVKNSNLDFDHVLKNAVFAIHPGGPKIIESIQSLLQLQDQQVSASREILLKRGNMSSATLPHVWDSLLQQKISSGTIVISLAFGPGLTIFGAAFEVI